MRYLLLWVFFLFIFSQTFANEKITILNYKNLSESNIEKLNISTTDETVSKIIDDKINKKIYLDIIDTINKNDIDLIVKYNWKVYNHRYRYSPKFLNNFSIYDSIKLKRLQKKPLSCELSVTADILSHLMSQTINEEEVLSKIDNKYLNILPFTYQDKLFWWNPNVWFVGYIDYYGEKNEKPTQRDMTGYGVYERPISKVYETYWFKNEILTKENYNLDFDSKKNLTYLLKNLSRWNMIQLWWDWCTREEYDDWTISKYDINQEKVDDKIYAKNYCTTTLEDRKIEWYYIENFELKKHTWLIGEHAFYLLWYEWWVENPTKIIVWDSDTGYHKYDTEEWMRKWSLMDYKSIIVYKK